MQGLHPRVLYISRQMGQARNAPTALSAGFSAVQGKQHLSQPGPWLWFARSGKGGCCRPHSYEAGSKAASLAAFTNADISPRWGRVPLIHGACYGCCLNITSNPAAVTSYHLLEPYFMPPCIRSWEALLTGDNGAGILSMSDYCTHYGSFPKQLPAHLRIRD